MIDRIQHLLDLRGSPLSAVDHVDAGLANGVHPYLLVGIAGAETQFGTDPRAGLDITAVRHNPYGYGPHFAFDSWRTACFKIAGDLRRNYLNQGRRTVVQIRDRWAPLGAANDPYGLNPGWARNVRGVIAQLGGDPDTPVGPAMLPWAANTWLLRRFPWLPKRGS
jgi:hypothetical protein